MKTHDTTTAQPASPRDEAVAGQRRFDSRQLFANQREVIIDHQAQEYRLRLTSTGKLILTK